MFRASTKGASPGRFFLKDWAMNLFGAVSRAKKLPGSWPNDVTAQIALPIWRIYVDKKINDHVTEHKAYLEERGLYS